jgi:hypothetical protein
MPHLGLPQTRRWPWINTTSLKVREHKNNPLLTVVAAASGTQALRSALRQTEFRRTSQTKFRMNTSRSLKAEWRSVWVSYRPSTRSGRGWKGSHACVPSPDDHCTLHWCNSPRSGTASPPQPRHTGGPCSLQVTRSTYTSLHAPSRRKTHHPILWLPLNTVNTCRVGESTIQKPRQICLALT